MRIPFPVIIASLAFSCVCNSQPSATRETSDRSVDYVLERYIESMGGRATIAQVRSIRLSGTISYPDGNKHRITVLKKKPNLTRVVLDAGFVRLIQAYDGEVAWIARETASSTSYGRMKGKDKEIFVREAPLENVLFQLSDEDISIELGPDVQVAMRDCYQVIARFEDGTKNIFYIDKQDFVERRIFEYDKDGILLNELIPGKFETFDGVVFAMQIVRLEDGKYVSSLNFDELETNVGILDTAFNPPVELP